MPRSERGSVLGTKKLGLEMRSIPPKQTNTIAISFNPAGSLRIIKARMHTHIYIGWAMEKPLQVVVGCRSCTARVRRYRNVLQFIIECLRLRAAAAMEGGVRGPTRCAAEPLPSSAALKGETLQKIGTKRFAVYYFRA
jgi:hypothetical protein